MPKPFTVLPLAILVAMAITPSALAQAKLTAKGNSLRPQPASKIVESDRVRDGLVGPVRRVRTEVVKLSTENGRVSEGKRALLEIVAYDIRGNKIENQYFPVAGATLTGKETYKYDDKGNISEMTLLNADGSLAGREVYKYDFDFAGNWNKMITSVAVVDSGKVSFEPAEVTYRSIMYYLDENMSKMVQPAAPATAPQTASPKPIDLKSQAAGASAVPKTNTSDQKLVPMLPSSVVTPDKLTAVNTGEIKGVAEETTPIEVVLDSDPPPTPAPRPLLKPVSGGVLNGTALNLPTPGYPENAKRMRISGLVSVNVVVDETGKVISAETTSGPVALRDAAVQAALRARFSPTRLSGQPVKVSGVINYKFSLTQ